MHYVSWLNQTMSGISLCLPVGVRSLSVPGLARKPNSISYRLHLPNCTAIQVGSLQRVPSLSVLYAAPTSSSFSFSPGYLHSLSWSWHDLYAAVLSAPMHTQTQTHTPTDTKQSWSRRFFYIFDAVRLGQSRQHFTYMESSHAITILKICIKCTFKIYKIYRSKVISACGARAVARFLSELSQFTIVTGKRFHFGMCPV